MPRDDFVVNWHDISKVNRITILLQIVGESRVGQEARSLHGPLATLFIFFVLELSEQTSQNDCDRGESTRQWETLDVTFTIMAAPGIVPRL